MLTPRRVEGREFNPRPGHYSRMSFSPDQVSGTVFPHLNMPYLLAGRSDFKTVLKKIAQCFASGITQFLSQHTSKYQKRSKHCVCTRHPGWSMLCIGWQPDYFLPNYKFIENIVLVGKQKLQSISTFLY